MNGIISHERRTMYGNRVVRMFERRAVVVLDTFCDETRGNQRVSIVEYLTGHDRTRFKVRADAVKLPREPEEFMPNLPPPIQRGRRGYGSRFHRAPDNDSGAAYTGVWVSRL